MEHYGEVTTADLRFAAVRGRCPASRSPLLAMEIPPMSLERILEPEVMDSPQEAADYDAMDHREVNRWFVEDLLASLEGSGFRDQGSGGTSDDERSTRSVLSTEYSVPSGQPDDTLPGPGRISAPLSPKPQTLNPEPSCLDILDLGTGTAQIPIELCRQFADCRVMAADAAVSMLEVARYNIEVNSLTERIELAHVDAKKLPFGNQMFDVVMSNSIVHHIPEPVEVLREAVRVTRAGGQLFFRDLLRPESEERLRQLVEIYTAGANDHQRQMFAESLHAALSLDEIRELVVSLGFSANGVQQTTDRHWTWITKK
jgi:ubiquinone/menaquinone biosynthesis C-methylase UbiE